MALKFRPGDLARIGGSSNRPLPAAYRWLKRGQVLKVKAIAGRMSGGHVLYRFFSRRSTGTAPGELRAEAG